MYEFTKIKKANLNFIKYEETTSKVDNLKSMFLAK